MSRRRPLAKRGLVPIQRGGPSPVQLVRDVPTSPADAGITVWPQCATCTMAHGAWVPVEGYSVEDERPSELAITRTLVVRAECSHRAAGRWGEARVQTARIHLPRWWGEAHRIEAIRQVRFFVPGETPENRMLA